MSRQLAVLSLDTNKMPPCDLAEVQAPRVACDDDIEYIPAPVDEGECSIRLLVAETGAQNSSLKH